MTEVGEQNSLKLVLGSKLDGKPVKYRVFISEAGTTISKVFFDVDPAYPGEQTFFLHGIHYVQVIELTRKNRKDIMTKINLQAGTGFKEWNKNKEACFFPDQRRLTFFKSYLQENCERECSWNRCT